MIFRTELCRVLTVNLLVTGYPMAKNLRAKIPASDKLIVHDVNEKAMRQFAEEATTANIGHVETTDNARTLAEQSVSHLTIPYHQNR